MAKAKRKNLQHEIDKAGQALLQSQLPAHWELRAYHPDYGLDYALEAFTPPDDERVSETLGEHLFIQLKSVAKPEPKRLKVYNRFNVEKRPEELEGDDPTDIVETVVFSIETSELVTVERMGVGRARASRHCGPLTLKVLLRLPQRLHRQDSRTQA